jgi:hypothetical protein
MELLSENPDALCLPPVTNLKHGGISHQNGKRNVSMRL